MTYTRAIPPTTTITLIDDSDLAQAGLRTLMRPYANRVCVLDNSAALAAPTDLDVILFEPHTHSSVSLGMMRDLQARSEAVVVSYSWAPPESLSSTLPKLSKLLTAPRLVAAVRELAARAPAIQAPGRAAAPQPGSVADRPAGPVRPHADAQHEAVDVRDLLTPRETDMLCLIARGCTNREIATDFNLSINSVKTYIRTAYRKIGVERRSQAMLWAIDRGLGAGTPALAG